MNLCLFPGGRGKAVRICEFDESNGGSRWLDGKYVGCGEEEDYQLSLPELSKVRTVLLTPVTPDDKGWRM